MRRAHEILEQPIVTISTERGENRPYGLHFELSGGCGTNRLI